MKIKVYNQNGETVGDQELNPGVFGVEINEGLVHQAVTAQMANQRQVLAHTKTKGEVRGGGRKPWRQKGTGRARAGSSRSPIWIGGGITFGPRKDRNFTKNINAKMKQRAVLMALSDKAKSGFLVLLDKIELPEAKTKKANEIISSLENKVLYKESKEEKNKKKIKRSVLIFIEKKDENIKRALGNLAGVQALNLNNINIVDILKYRDLILTVDAVKKIEEKYSKK
ncbi:50S ribosomal protein L4 [Candidatus Falkowbacteria bacterium CG10_big_fil_rev_8_21_14_0_10_43_10]|uniref:Large ribosomal subunit protein uL4 n=1 Tax=Candidatus Falkowbacteria bacterium CG10_big_fil_rev_8_21_14_0_10_43_10 TaxID=1974567 RepID=A0A2H0V2K4_9BACT|nr:MAG: 50S ribosomal protein L4 [Candidatus Falkowbacteria bacterium CG10_big_fil_rev_8_21_14_0_10_43_10]